MAESTLSLGYDDIQIEIGRLLGYVVTAAAIALWTAETIAEVDRIIQAGYRQFLYPPAVQGIEAGYEWSFLKPTAEITTIARYTTGSLAVVGTTCTITTGVWPSWAYTHGTLVIDDVEYPITSRTSDADIEVTGTATTAAEDDWYLKHAGYQDLPDSFGRILGDLHFEADEYSKSVPVVSEHQIQMHLQQSIDESRPQYATTRFKSSDGSDGQRQEIIWWPIPDEAYVLTYRHEAFTGKLIKATNKYALGGMKHSEVIIESCMAIAEQRVHDDKGLHWDAFTRLLVTAIAQDRKNGARYFGPMSHGEGVSDNASRSRYQGSSYDITYKGLTW